jgi:formylglycine-generating enzyme
MFAPAENPTTARGPRAVAPRDSIPALTAAPPGTPRRRPRGAVPVALAALGLGAVAASVVLAVPARREAPLAPAEQASPPAPFTLTMDDEDLEPGTLEEQRRRLFGRMQRELDLPDEALGRVERIFATSPVLGQGNPALSRHPMSRSSCRLARTAAGVSAAREPACGAPNMVPLFDPTRGQTAADARVCIDQFEFPDIPCEYPVVHVRAREAALLCRALGKRICDAHEWEGACAGALRDPDVEYEWARPLDEATWHHNYLRDRTWSYGREQDQSLCATGSFRTPGCPGGGWDKCGSNTYPAGAFPACRSSFGAFDLHGNVAEHMSLPLLPGELARHGDHGFTEMKGSWFVFSTVAAHEDDCRWRAPDWHRTRLMSEASHANYHLGFRCCKDKVLVRPRASSVAIDAIDAP